MKDITVGIRDKLIKLTYNKSKDSFEVEGYNDIKNHINNIANSKEIVQLKNLDEMHYYGYSDSEVLGNVVVQEILRGVKIITYNGEQYYIPKGVCGNNPATPLFINRWYDKNYLKIIAPPATSNRDIDIDIKEEWETKDYRIFLSRIDEQDYIAIEPLYESFTRYILKTDIEEARNLTIQEWDELFEWHYSLKFDSLDNSYISEIIMEMEYLKYL